MVVACNFQHIFNVPNDVTKFSLPALKQINLKIEFENADGLSSEYAAGKPLLPFAASEVFDAVILDSRRLTASNGDCKDVYEVTFDISGSNFTFKPGDTIGIIPHNRNSEVDLVINHLELQTPDACYKLTVDSNQKGAKVPAHVPVKSTLRHVLTHCLDLRSIVKKLFILALSKYTKEQNEKRTLEYLCSKEGSHSYTTHILNRNICILDIFTMFKSCKPPIELLLASLPRLLPRPYSILNSGLHGDGILKICFSVMDVGNNRKGLTTGWLEELILNDDIEHKMKNLSLNNQIKIPIHLRKNMSGFLVPELSTPVIMIGPGTGVAPFIGFLEYREYYKETESSTNLGKSWLFFGCRDPDLDYIYKEDIDAFVKKGVLDKICTAFSKVEGSEIKYVQDALTRNGQEVTKLIKEGAHIYICGDLKNMATQVKDVLVKCLVDHDGRTLQEAEAAIRDMQKNKQYLIDMWS